MRRAAAFLVERIGFTAPRGRSRFATTQVAIGETDPELLCSERPFRPQEFSKWFRECAGGWRRESAIA
jgi:hypothetical protein